jgi:hypothetical protein
MVPAVPVVPALPLPIVPAVPVVSDEPEQASNETAIIAIAGLMALRMGPPDSSRTLCWQEAITRLAKLPSVAARRMSYDLFLEPVLFEAVRRGR